MVGGRWAPPPTEGKRREAHRRRPLQTATQPGVMPTPPPPPRSPGEVKDVASVAAFCRPVRPVLLLVSFPRSRSLVVEPTMASCHPHPPSMGSLTNMADVPQPSSCAGQG